MDVAELTQKIKQKPELCGLDDSIVEDLILSYIKKHSISLEKLKKSDLKTLIKLIRAELRLYSGRFQRGLTNRKDLLESGRINELIKSHSSTQERLSSYSKIINIIEQLKPKSILDLGCGLNPIVLAKPGVFYHASDIKQDELSLIDNFFKLNRISGDTFVFDLRKISENYKTLPEADLCILFKVLDIIENKGHKIAEEIVKKVPCSYFIVSFSTRKLSGKPMNFPKRKWFELLLQRLNYKYKTLKTENEIFYIFSKTSQ